MIEKDYKARCEGSRKSRITEYFPKNQSDKPTISDHNHENIADEQAIPKLADDPIDFEDDFSDGDFSLPDIEDLLKDY